MDINLKLRKTGVNQFQISGLTHIHLDLLRQKIWDSYPDEPRVMEKELKEFFDLIVPAVDDIRARERAADEAGEKQTARA